MRANSGYGSAMWASENGSSSTTGASGAKTALMASLRAGKDTALDVGDAPSHRGAVEADVVLAEHRDLAGAIAPVGDQRAGMAHRVVGAGARNHVEVGHLVVHALFELLLHHVFHQ